LLLTALSFFVGRVVEQHALATKSSSLQQQAPLPTPAIKPRPPTYRELTAAEIIALPFGEFYEALRSAPGEAREKWRVDLERMPAGPRRNAAVAGFYKLLVQFDPVIATKNACEVEDRDLRDLALASIVGAAPGFALKDIAAIFLKLPPDASYSRNYFEEIISQWVPIDPAAVARFYEEHPEIAEQRLDGDMIASWAALDPEAARLWLNSHDHAGDVIADFVMGLYVNDRDAAVDFAVAHAGELATMAGLDRVLAALYSDSKEEIKKFIERLPNDELRHNAFRGFEMAVQFGTAEETGEPERTPRAVADWMVQFPPEYWHGHLAEVLHFWNHVPPQEVFSWIGQQPPSIRSTVAAEYKMGVGDKVVDVVSALLQYGNTDIRDQLTFALFKNSPSDTTQMKEALVSSLLPAAQKQYVLNIAARAEAAIEEQKAKERLEDQGSEK
jgi:hypothetical protein